MRKFIKWFVIVLGSLIGLVLLGAVGITISTSARLNKVYDIPVETISIPADVASLAEGQRLVSIYCAGCHGEDLAGKEFFNEPALAVIDAPNLTPGQGGVGEQYRDTDWLRALRHGIGPDGKSLFIMPSKDFYYLSDEDMGQIIAYLKSLAPIDRKTAAFAPTFLGRLMVGMGVFGEVIVAESIDHEGQRTAPPAPGITADYGNYLSTTFGCATCHGERLAGGKDPDPAAPLAPDITASGSLATWSDQDFINIVRTRRSDWMPFNSLDRMSDDELKAIFMYLQSLPGEQASAN